MLEIVVPGQDLWDELDQEFVTTKETKLMLEHSLISLSKWESETHKPFLDTKELTRQQTVDYIRCMTILPQHVPLDVYRTIPDDIVEQVTNYISDSMTATWFSDDKKSVKTPGKHQVVTSEVIYYRMIQFGIPAEYQKWHLNRLLTLIRVCQEMNKQPGKKRSPKEIAQSRRAINEARKKALHTNG